MTACGSVPADAKYGPLRSTEGSHDYLRDILIDQIPLQERSGRLVRAGLSEPEMQRLLRDLEAVSAAGAGSLPGAAACLRQDMPASWNCTRKNPNRR